MIDLSLRTLVVLLAVAGFVAVLVALFALYLLPLVEQLRAVTTP